jgi:hypothetical protein
MLTREQILEFIRDDEWLEQLSNRWDQNNKE